MELRNLFANLSRRTLFIAHGLLFGVMLDKTNRVIELCAMRPNDQVGVPDILATITWTVVDNMSIESLPLPSLCSIIHLTSTPGDIQVAEDFYINEDTAIEHLGEVFTQINETWRKSNEK